MGLQAQERHKWKGDQVQSMPRRKRAMRSVKAST